MATNGSKLIETLQSNIRTLQELRPSTQHRHELDDCISTTGTFLQKVLSDRDGQEPEGSRQELDKDTCPICYGQYDNAVQTPCGHVYCSECVSRWLEQNDTCPSCRFKGLYEEDLRQCRTRGVTSALAAATQAVAGTQVTARTQPTASTQATITTQAVANATSVYGDRCSVCRGNQLLLQTRCHHIFCFDCISAQLRRPERQRCPFCRSRLQFTDLEPLGYRREGFATGIVRPRTRSSSPSIARSLLPPPVHLSTRAATAPTPSLPTRPVWYRSITDIPDSVTRGRVRRMQQYLPFESVHRCYEVLMAQGGHTDDAIDYLLLERDEDRLDLSPGYVLDHLGRYRGRL
jgi:hypothetical protein